MENLLVRARRMFADVLEKQIAEMKVIRIYSYVRMICMNLYYDVIRILAKFVKSLEAKCSLMHRVSFDSLCMQECEAVDRNGAPRELLDSVKYHTIWALGNPFVRKNNDDAMSAAITKAASHILPHKEIEGKSVYEINDVIFRKYADKRKHNYLFYLRLWLGIAIAACVLFVTILKLRLIGVTWAVTLFFIILAVDYLMIERRISIWHMAKLVWIIMSETNAEENYEFPLQSLGEEDLHVLELRMRTLHTLLNSSNTLNKDIDRIKTDIASTKDNIDRNQQMISKLSDEISDENNRIIASKQDDNTKLRGTIEQYNNELAKKEKESATISSLIDVIERNLEQVISSQWGKAYSHLLLAPDVLKRVVENFTFADLTLIERRFFELDNTQDPKAIAKGKDNNYSVDFVTTKGDIASILFTGGCDKPVQILNMVRTEPLVDVFVTHEELAKAVSGLKKGGGNTNSQIEKQYSKQIEELKEILSDSQKKWEEERRSLEAINGRLEVEKSKLSDDILGKEAEIDDLSDRISAKESECEKLQLVIDKLSSEGNADQEQIRKLQNALEKSRQQLDALESQYDSKVQEIDMLYERITGLDNQQQQLASKLKDKEKEVAALKDKIDATITSKNKEIEALNIALAKNEENLGIREGLLEIAQKNESENAEKIVLLEREIAEYKKENGELKNKIKDKHKELDEAKAKESSLKAEVHKLNAEIAKVASRMSNDQHLRILHNREIYIELDAWIEKAQKELDIIVPFVDGDQANYMKERFKRATRDNDLKIRLLFGYGDKNKYGVVPEKNRGRLEKARKNVKEWSTYLGQRNFRAREINTHIKLVIVDDREFMIGSANILSFAGQYDEAKKAHNDLHSEIMMVSDDKKQISELKKKYFDW